MALMSLWKVDDQATSQLMIDFYSNLVDGLDPKAALRTAQMKMMKSGKFTRPYYWGGFVLTGMNWFLRFQTGFGDRQIGRDLI